MIEIWKNYIYNYDISNLGRVRNYKTGKILKPSVDGNGYLGVVVSLGKRGKSMRIRIHRAVAEVFIPNPNNLPQVNHKNGIKTCNEVWNLEWCECSYNTKHAYDIGLHKKLEKEQNPVHKLTRQQVLYIRKYYKCGDKQFGARALARLFNVHHSTIEDIINHKIWL